MTINRYAPLAALAAAGMVVGAAGCSGGSGQSAAGNDTGSLSIGLIDAPVTEVENIFIQIKALRIKPNGDGPAIEFEFDDQNLVEVDLLELTADNAEWLLSGETVPAGAYNWLELELNAALDGVLDSYVVTDVGGHEEIEVRVPSGSLRLVSGFTVTADQETRFLIDWDMRQALLAPPGQQPGYILRPAFRVIDMTEFGTLSGSVADTAILNDDCNLDDPVAMNPDVGNVVYIFAGHDTAPEDIFSTDTDDGTEPGPVATVAVAQNAAGLYVYSTILSPGDYTAAFTCVAGNDDPATDDWDSAAETGTVIFGAPANFSIAADEQTSVDF